MSVKLRLKRFGRRHKPFFRLNAMDVHTPRDGKTIEELGYFNPLERDAAKQTNFKAERVKYWLSVGAIPSETVAALLKKSGIDVPNRAPKRVGKAKEPRVRKNEAKAKAEATAAAAKAEPAKA